MALAIATAHVEFHAYPQGNATALVRYRVEEQAQPDLARVGVITVDLPASMRAQLETIIEDGLRAAGKL